MSRDYDITYDKYSVGTAVECGVPSIEARAIITKNTGILKVFEIEGKDLKIDKKLIKRLTNYVSTFVTRNEDHIHFFGSGLTGVYPLRFTTAHRNEFFDDVVELDDIMLKDRIHSLPDINPKFHVSSDILNITLIWLVYKIYNTDLPSNDKAAGMAAALKMMHYKFISSLMAKYFKYPADESIALATYHQLNLKFDLRMYETWGGLVDHRVSDFLTKGSLWFDVLTTLKYDMDVVKLINDMQSRIRASVKVVTRDYYAQKDNDARIMSTSSTMLLEDSMVVKDVSSEVARLRSYIITIAGAPEFIKPEAQDIICQIMHTVMPKYLDHAVTFISENYGAPRCNYISEFVIKLADYTLDYVRNNDIDLTDIITILHKLRGVLMSSRNTETEVAEIRELGDKVISVSVHSKSDTAKAAVRTATCLYVILRMLLRQKYS